MEGCSMQVEGDKQSRGYEGTRWRESVSERARSELECAKPIDRI